MTDGPARRERRRAESAYFHEMSRFFESEPFSASVVAHAAQGGNALSILALKVRVRDRQRSCELDREVNVTTIA